MEVNFSLVDSLKNIRLSQHSTTVVSKKYHNHTKTASLYKQKLSEFINNTVAQLSMM